MSEGVIGIAGPPGAGKSALLATFATLRRPNSGALEILGHDTGNSAGLRAIRARIGFLPGRFSWAATMTAAEFTGYSAYYKGMRTPDVRQVLKRLDLTEAADTPLSLLPPDVRMRAGLAATCVHEPDLVLLNEPLHGLDGGGRDLVPVLRSLAPTVVATAESAADLAPWCDRVFTLDRGRLDELPPRAAGVPAPRAAAPRASRAGSGGTEDGSRACPDGARAARPCTSPAAGGAAHDGRAAGPDRPGGRPSLRTPPPHLPPSPVLVPAGSGAGV
ncbi:ATP-binding cassette domain-containing protein [Actinomadura parmotrematis]|nr:ATP-binding cassette domain-containing protein [Actinomadura parmotrematis]